MPLKESLKELLSRIETLSNEYTVNASTGQSVDSIENEEKLLEIINTGIGSLENELVSYKNQLEESSIMLETQLEEISKTYEELSTLYEVTRILSKTLDPLFVTGPLIDSIKNSIPSDGIGIAFHYMAVDEFVCSFEENKGLQEYFPICKERIKAYITGEDPKTLILEGDSLERFDFPELVKSLIIIPISGNDVCFGGLVLVNRQLGDIFTAGDRKLLESIANQIHFSIENYIYLQDKIEQERLREQLSIAKEIQNSLLPSQIIQPENVQITASFSPAVEVAGDYYDCFPIEDKTFLIVADVSGKGIPASLLMSSFRSAVRIIVDNTASLPELVSKVNDHIAQNDITDRFVTSMFILLDQKAGTFKYSNAGHDPIILYRKKTDEFFEISNSGIPIGIFEDQDYEEDIFQLESDDVFIVYTDGIPEARNTSKEEFGFERTRAVLKDNCEKSAEEIKEAMLKALRKFVGEAKQHDDTTFMVIKYSKTQ
ncbi:MAG TPA: PP2C family protein-serine/threonine phosphatase [Thermotogota bacterium]|nr:PP2C family protein-serine/threonine phosphatase [Thermotogota bacterium]HPJ88425.1 PP2C family protein-serine/threonine phosphatase [Thermotogota bacterium]HPR95408.1 PP2C family protein-serine/threonine phosphatase [Thermotogota bacterium]